MESLFDRYRRLGRKVQTVVLILALITMTALIIVSFVERSDAHQTYLVRVDYGEPGYTVSPDGLVLESYAAGRFQQSVLFRDFVPSGIRICSAEGETLWEMPGRVVTCLLWSPDGRYAVISYSTDTEGRTVVVDTTDFSEQELVPPAEAGEGPLYYYAVSWNAAGLLMCWDYGERQAVGEFYWEP